MQTSKLAKWYESRVDLVAFLCFFLPVLSLYIVPLDFFISIALSYTLLRLGYEAFLIQLAAFLVSKTLLIFNDLNSVLDFLIVGAVLLNTVALKLTRSLTQSAVVTTTVALLVTAILHYYVPADEAYWENMLNAITSMSAENQQEVSTEDIAEISQYMSALNALFIVCIGVITSYMSSILALRVAKSPMHDAQCDVVPTVLPLGLLLICLVGTWAGINGAMQLLIVTFAPFVLSGVLQSWQYLSMKAPAPLLFKVLYILLCVVAFQLMGLLMLLFGLIRSIAACGEEFLYFKK
jgi:hypothetical protein